MPGLIVGDKILDRGLLENAVPENLKNSTCDLTVGEIVAVGPAKVEERISHGGPRRYFLAPREMVFVLSNEEFRLPSTVTGLATLRTSLTKKGLLALNVGIIDPFFSGPISTSLLNFSDRPVEISVGEKFFRVIFIDHEDVSPYRPTKDESIHRDMYVHDLETQAYSEFPRTYLNVPTYDKKFYFANFWNLVFHGLTHGPIGWFISFCIILLIWFLLSGTSLIDFYKQKLSFIKPLWPF